MILLFVHSENIKLLFKTKFNKCAANILNFLSTADQKIKAWSVASMHGVPQGDSIHTHTYIERERRRQVTSHSGIASQPLSLSTSPVLYGYCESHHSLSMVTRPKIRQVHTESFYLLARERTAGAKYRILIFHMFRARFDLICTSFRKRTPEKPVGPTSHTVTPLLDSYPTSSPSSSTLLLLLLLLVTKKLPLSRARSPTLETRFHSRFTKHANQNL